MIGTILQDKYRIDALIGSGGMANVYRATVILSGRTVAIKVLKEEYAKDPEYLRRFDREARSVLSLSHENIVRAYGTGEHEGTKYIVSEYVEGDTLKELIRKNGTMSPKVAANIISQLLDALQHAHDRGLIHRDIKPQNIIITKKGIVKLADFGIAREVDSSTRTFAGQNVLGSVHYLSPEQAKGEEALIESDIYSAGTTLYEMLTGQVPFEGETSVAVALKHIREQLIPPIEVNPAIPISLSDVVMKATSKDPMDRYHSAKEFKNTLNRALRNPSRRFLTHGDIKKRNTEEKNSGIGKIVLFIAAALTMFVVLFLIVRSMKDDETSTDRVPTLVNKTIAAAKELADLRGYTVAVGGFAVSYEYDEGVVISQTPAAGATGSEGSVITVVISQGSDTAVMPNLVDLSLQDAVNAVKKAGLSIESVEYSLESGTLGNVFKQSPDAGTELVKDDGVTLWVNGKANMNLAMPDVTTLSSDEAINRMRESGFTKIRIRYVAPDGNHADGSIVAQSPEKAVLVPVSSTIELTIAKNISAYYGMDFVVNVNIANKDTPVIVTRVTDENTEVILYEGKLPAGTQVPLSFDAKSSDAGQQECVIYVDGIEVKRDLYNFTYRG